MEVRRLAMKDHKKTQAEWTRRDFIKMTSIGLGALTIEIPPGFAFATEGKYPSEPIDIITPFSVGGGTDIWMRTFSVALAGKKSLRVPVNINNIPGAASLRGVTAAYSAKPDGYTLVAFNPPSTPWSWFIHQPDFDIEKFVGVSVFAREPGVVAVNANSKYRDFKSILDAYKEQKLKIIASLGIGTGWHVASLLMKKRFNLNWQQYVSYKGTADVVAALYRNEVEVGVLTAASAADGVKEGRLRVLAVLGLEERLSTFPDSPTLKELGKDPLKETLFLRSVYAPPGTPENIQKVLEEAFTKAQDSSIVMSRYNSLGLTPAYGTGKEAEQAIKDAIKVANEIDLRAIVKDKK